MSQQKQDSVLRRLSRAVVRIAGVIVGLIGVIAGGVAIYDSFSDRFTHVIHVEMSDFKPLTRDDGAIQFLKMGDGTIYMTLEGTITVRNDKESSVELDRAYFLAREQEPDTETNRLDWYLCDATTIETSNCFYAHDNPYIIPASSSAKFNVQVNEGLAVDVANTLDQYISWQEPEENSTNQYGYLEASDAYGYLQGIDTDLYGTPCAHMTGIDGIYQLVYDVSHTDVRHTVTTSYLDFGENGKITSTFYGTNSYDSMYLQIMDDGGQKLLTYDQYLDTLDETA